MFIFTARREFCTTNLPHQSLFTITEVSRTARLHCVTFYNLVSVLNYLFSSEVNTPFDKYILAAKDERDMRIWMQALRKAAVSSSIVHTQYD